MMSTFRLQTRIFINLIADNRISLALKAGFAVIAVAYLVYPLDAIPDVIPVIGWIDDALVILLGALVFNHICPSRCRVEALARAIGRPMSLPDRLIGWEPPWEGAIMVGLYSLSVFSMMVGGMLAGVAHALIMGAAYVFYRIERAGTLANSVEVNAQDVPDLHAIVQDVRRSVPLVAFRAVIADLPTMNASVSGLAEPYVIVLDRRLTERLSGPQVKAILLHEVFHAALGHTLMRGLFGLGGGITRGLVLMAWTRQCEYSADALAAHYCGNPTVLMSALLATVSGGASIDPAAFIHRMQDAAAGRDARIAELVSGHPLLCNRVLRLSTFAAEV